MRTLAFITLLAMTAFAAQGQTEYRIDQQLPGTIDKIQIYDGWNVQLIHDTVNYISIATPCEYYFAEGNEPQICRQHSDGWLSLWKNTSMPQGSHVEIHYRDSLQKIDVHPHAIVSADTLLMLDTEEHYGDINVKKGATLRVKEICCNGFLSIDADTAANVRIGTLRAGLLKLWSKQETTLMLDSIDAREVDYRRDPLANDNLRHSIPERNIKVSTRNRWFMKGLKRLDNTIGLAFNTPFEQKYNNPLASNYNISMIIGLKTNVIPMNQRLGLSLGIDFGMSAYGLLNNLSLNGRTLTLDTVSPGVNRQHELMQIYLGLPAKVHYLPKGELAQGLFHDLHIGLEPRWYFYQHYTVSQYTGSQTSLNTQDGSFWNFGHKVNAYNPLQLRAEIGFRLKNFINMEFNFFVDLLRTYRNITGLEKEHSFGFQLKF